MTLNYVSLFSGIEAFSVAASRIRNVDWRPVFFSEIEPFPCAVLAHHFPNVPNLGDICQIRVDREKETATNGDTTIALPRTGIDILAGGSPCQDVSVAGKRAGMSEGSGTRSSLTFEYARLVRELRPRVLLWENVPGVLSANGGHDFAAFLHTLDELGYSLAWRVLDCQYTRVDSARRAVPQRRRRVWLVGCLGGDGRVPAQILFERADMLGDTPPRREVGQGLAAPAGYGPARNDRVVSGARGVSILRRNPPEYRTGDVAAHRLTSHTVMDAQAEDLCVAAPLCAADGKGKNGMDICGKVAIVPALSSVSFDGADVSPILHRPNGAPGYSDQELFAQQGAFLVRVATFVKASHETKAGGTDRYAPSEVCTTLNTFGNHSDIRATDLVVSIDMDKCKPSNAERTRRGSSAFGVSEDGAAYTIQAREGASKQNAVAIGIKYLASEKSREPTSIDVSQAIGSGRNDQSVLDCRPQNVGIPCKSSPGGENAVAIGFKAGQSANGGLGAEEEVCPTQSSQPSALEPTVALFTPSHIVRRLTPGECETLQFFPQGWTRIPYRGKPAEQCPDSPRYKALSNSWATNCAEWILRRIVAAFRLGIIDSL